MPNIEVKKKSINMNINAGKIYPPLENLEVNPTKEKQTFKSDSYGYDEVVVNGANLQDKTVNPIETEQVITADEGYVGLNEVTVSKVQPIPYKPRWITFYNYQGTDLTQELESLDTSNLTSTKYMFSQCIKLTNINVSKFNTSNVKNMYRMFESCQGVTSTVNLSSFNTSNVTDMSEMFSWCSSWSSIDVSSFNTSKVTTMYKMFSACRKAKSITGVSNFNVGRLTNTSEMFNSCEVLTELDLSGWDTTTITTCTNMFSSCKALTSLKLGNINMCNATSFSSMFNSCESLTELDLSKWETPKVTNMYQMFCNCKLLQKLDIRNFTFTKVTSYANMFMNVPVDCLIIVKDETEKAWVLARRSDLTNVKTVAELEG